MNKLFILAILPILFIGCVGQNNSPAFNSKVAANKNLNTNNMKISSTAFISGDKIPMKYTCDGNGVNPPLTFSEVPADAKSLVLIMDDPDAVKPAGKVWDHWIIWNIMPLTTGIAEDSVPKGIVGMNSGGRQAYGPPCPPDGQHRYFFKLYALNALLDLPFNSGQVAVIKAMEGYIIDRAELTGVYSR